MIARMRAWILLGWFLVSNGAWAAEADLAGLWKNTTAGISQSAIIVSQEGAFLHVAGYGVWADGGPGVWHGKGKIEGAIYRDWETDRKSTRLNSSHRL